MSEAALSLARRLLLDQGGEPAALRHLERSAEQDDEISSDANIWAAIGFLRKTLGDSRGAEEAYERAAMLKRASLGVSTMVPSKISFEEQHTPLNASHINAGLVKDAKRGPDLNASPSVRTERKGAALQRLAMLRSRTAELLGIRLGEMREGKLKVSGDGSNATGERHGRQEGRLESLFARSRMLSAQTANLLDAVRRTKELASWQGGRPFVQRRGNEDNDDSDETSSSSESSSSAGEAVEGEDYSSNDGGDYADDSGGDFGDDDADDYGDDFDGDSAHDDCSCGDGYGGEDDFGGADGSGGDEDDLPASDGDDTDDEQNNPEDSEVNFAFTNDESELDEVDDIHPLAYHWELEDEEGGLSDAFEAEFRADECDACRAEAAVVSCEWEGRDDWSDCMCCADADSEHESDCRSLWDSEADGHSTSNAWEEFDVPRVEAEGVEDVHRSVEESAEALVHALAGVDLGTAYDEASEEEGRFELHTDGEVEDARDAWEDESEGLSEDCLDWTFEGWHGAGSASVSDATEGMEYDDWSEEDEDVVWMEGAWEEGDGRGKRGGVRDIEAVAPVVAWRGGKVCCVICTEEFGGPLVVGSVEVTGGANGEGRLQKGVAREADEEIGSGTGKREAVMVRTLPCAARTAESEKGGMRAVGSEKSGKEGGAREKRKRQGGHTFHAACIDKWLQTHHTCPTCRCDIRPGSERVA